MRATLQFSAMLLAWLTLSRTDAWAQTPTLEFAPGPSGGAAINPTGNGPTTGDQIITFLNNTDNPGANNFVAYAPTTTATFALSGQQYASGLLGLGANRGLMFGGQTGGNNSPSATLLFPLVNSISGSTNNNYTSANNIGVSTGINTAANSAVALFTDATYVSNPVANTRYRYADITITFNQPMVNPVIHVTGLGSNNGTQGYYTTELDLLTTGVTLSRLSGSGELVVNATQIQNNASNPTTATNNGAASGSIQVVTPSAGITSLQFRVYLRTGNTVTAIATANASTGDGWLLAVSKLTPTTVTGTVFEDANYGGGAGRPLSASGTVARPDATVELYDNTGNFVATTTTDTNGQYTFNVPAGTYTVRVVNSTVTSARTGYVAGLLPVQTYNGTTTRVGGENPALVDAGPRTGTQTLGALTTGTTTAESIATVTATGSSTAGPDFGFNFDVVVNTNNTGQGSLRQFITNANALGGETALAQSGSRVNITTGATVALTAGVESSIFMIPNGTARPGLLASSNGGPASLLTSGVAAIAPTAALPNITGTLTIIDGTTQTFNIGNTNNVTLGTGGTVGTGATALTQLSGPEVQLRGTTGFNGLTPSANNITVRGLSLYGFSTNILAGVDITGTRIEQNVIGTSATSFTDPGTGVRTLNEGINLNGSDNGTISNNLIGFNGGMGIWLQSNGANGANSNTVTGNEIRGNAITTIAGNGERLVFDGVELQGNSTGNTVSGNLITGSYGHGIDSFGNDIGGNTISGNTISNNGVGIATNTGEEGSGLRIFGTTNPTIISGNVLTGNNGSGVLVIGSANQVTISQNSMSGNTRLGIDLLSTTEGNTSTFWNGQTGATSNVTINDNGDGDTGGNGLFNFPVLTTATLNGTSLVVNGFARAGSLVELFLATPLTTDPTSTATVTNNKGFGQGSSYLASRTEGNATDDTNTGAATTYGPNNINGLAQGTDSSNPFTFTIALSSLTADQRTALLGGTAILTSTARLSNSTSEFSGNLVLPVADVATTLTGPTALSPGQASGSYTVAFTNNGPSPATNVTRRVTLPAGATVTAAQLPAGATFSTTGTVTTVDFGTLATLGSGITNSFNFSYTVPPTSGTYALTSTISNSESQGANTGADAVTLSIVVTGSPAGCQPSYFDNVNASSGLTAEYYAGYFADNISYFQRTAPIRRIDPLIDFSAGNGSATWGNLGAVAGGSATDYETYSARYRGSVYIATAGSYTFYLGSDDASYLWLDGAAFAPTTANATINNGGGHNFTTQQATVTLSAGLHNITIAYGEGGGDNRLKLEYENTALGITRQVVPANLFCAGPANTNAVPVANDVTNTFLPDVVAATILNPNLSGTDADGNATLSYYNIATLPSAASGTLLYNGALVVAGQAIPAGSLNLLTFDPSGGFNGNASFTYSVTDNNGRTDLTPATYTIPVGPVSCQPSYLDNVNASSGLTAEYYAGYFADNISYFQRTAPIRRIDATIDFSNGNGSSTWGNLSGVAGGLATDYDLYSARYRGSIYIAAAGSYTFYLGSDDASYLWLDGAALAPTTANATINNGGAHGITTLQATVTLSAGLHDITVAFGENVGGNTLKLEYASAANNIARQVIPSGLFCAGPATTNAAPVAIDATNTTLLSSAAASVLSPNLSGTDADGNATLSYYNIVTLPSAASGVLAFNGTPVVAGQAIPVGSISQLTFDPTAGFNGNTSFMYAITDNSGRTDVTPATYTIPVNGTADVTTTLAGQTSLNPGQATSTYTAAFTNNGPNPAINVAQQVSLPTGATNVFVNGVAYVPSGSIIDFGAAASLAVGATNIFSFSFTAPTTPGNVVISSAVTTNTPQGADTAPNSAILNATVGSPANVAATISPATGMATVTAGQPASFNVNFSNSGPATAAGVVASVQLPAGLGAVTASGGGVYDDVTGIVTYASITSYNSGGTTASVISFTAPASGPVTATASIRTTTSEAGQTANNTQSASISVTPTYDVTTSITGPASTAVGVQTTFSVMTINNGPSTAPSVVQTVTGLPTNLTNVYVSNGGTYNAANGTVTFPALETMANGTRVDNTISFTPITTNATGFTATATATANGTNPGDSNTGNNSVAASAMVVNAAPAASTNANIYTTITTPSANVLPGGAVAFTVTSGNRGAASATTVAQQTTLPAGLSNVVVRDANNNVVPNSTTTGYNSATGVVVVPNVAAILSGATTSYSISFTAPTSGMVAGVATISSANADSMPADNISTADVTVVPTTDVVVRLTGPASVVAGSSATYTVNTTNNGPVTATNVATTVAIPVGLTGVTVSGGGTYSAATGVVTFPATTSLLNGASASNTITYTVPNSASIGNVASVTSTTSDSQPANNTATVATAVKGVTDLTVALSGPATIVQGNQVDYVVAVTNNGPAAATNTVIKVQLPAGLSNVILSNGAYDAATGVATFLTLADQPAGADGAVSYGIRFIAPAGLTSLYAAATVSSGSEESSYTNNTANVTTTVLAPTAGQADLRIVVNPSTTTPVAGQPLTLSLSTTNLGTSTVAATNVVTRMSIEPGLPLSSVTATNGGVYDPATGIITFPAVASLGIGASVANSVVITMSGATPFTTRGLVSGDQSDPTASNNVDFQNLTVTQRADVATTISGPAAAQPGDLVTYSVATLNNGPSVATGVVQKVTIPAGATNVVISGGGTQSGNVVTFPTISNQVAGINGEVVNTISFNVPTTFTGSYDVVANVTTTSTQPTTPGTTNDDARVTTSKGNRTPVANAVVNSLRTPEGNTAGAMAISSLSGTDADGNATITTYTITSIPDATTQGVLRLNGGLVTASSTVLPTDVANLTFDPVASFVGNAFFTYTATDNAGAVSAPAIYTIPVGQDISAVYSLTTPKGGATPYQNGDVIANVFDVNGGSYDSAVPQAVTNTGIRTATLTTGTLPAGTTLDPVTGVITVTNRLLLVAGSYPVTVTTIDAYGGTNTSTFTVVIGTRPLPVELKTFEVHAVKVDALLDWSTASEKNNDHFDVERSLNGTTFEKIGTVRGQGTTQTATAYNFTDAGIGARTQSLVYYRLRQVDADGTVTYSPVRTVRFEAQAAATAKLSVFPNPATASDRIVTLDLSTLPKGTYQAAMLDATGRILGTYSVEGGINKTVDVQNLPTGTYIIQVRGNGLKLSVRLLKE
jgi:uncharacterized repeat protein (TIGR01451 family)